MKYELTQTFIFEAAHTLERQLESESSKRIHGHTYLAAVSLVGQPNPETGVVMDLAAFRQALATVREQLDHRMLDDIDGLGPATLENLCAYIWKSLEDTLPMMASVTVSRTATGDSCRLVKDERA